MCAFCEECVKNHQYYSISCVFCKNGDRYVHFLWKCVCGMSFSPFCEKTRVSSISYRDVSILWTCRWNGQTTKCVCIMWTYRHYPPIWAHRGFGWAKKGPEGPNALLGRQCSSRMKYEKVSPSWVSSLQPSEKSIYDQPGVLISRSNVLFYILPVQDDEVYRSSVEPSSQVPNSPLYNDVHLHLCQSTFAMLYSDTSSFEILSWKNTFTAGKRCEYLEGLGRGESAQPTVTSAY